VTLNVGVGLALVCAALTQLGFLCKHRGANAVPPIRLERPMHSARALLRSRWFATGLAVTAAAWLMHVAALALAPLSTVQAVLSTGVVLVAVLGAGLFGCKVSTREWLGVGMTAVGLVLLVATLPAHEGSHASFAWPALAAFEAGMLGVGALLIAAPRLGAPSHHHGAVLGAAAGMVVLLATLPHAGESSRVTSSGFLLFEGAMLGIGVLLVVSPRLGAPTQHHGTALGAAAGTLFGVSDVAVKALTGLAPAGPLAVVASPWLLVAGCAAVLAFLASARGFQQGDAVPVIACMSTGANVTCIVGGIAVFGDALASQTLLIVVQLTAFALVAAAALLTSKAHGCPSVEAAA
jgi:multidrug transporter EmrE-like cation transporter